MTRYPLAAEDRRHARAYRSVVRTGEYRAVRPGEWYLSGAIPEGYYAPHGTTTPYQIVALNVHPPTQKGPG